MDLTCPQCRGPIPLTDVNVQTDIALCRSCAKNFGYADLAEVERISVLDLSRPPKGTWLKEDPLGFEIGAITRHPIAFLLVPFCFLWAGGVIALFVGLFIQKGAEPGAMVAFPIFLMVAVIFNLGVLMTVFGKVVVRVQGNDGTIFIGLGKIGWTRRFKWNEVRQFRQTQLFWPIPRQQITMDADRRIDFGSGLNGARLEFMLGALRKMKAQPLATRR